MPIEKKQIKVGVTGAIGAGKTFVSSIFEKLGFPVFNSDIEAKKCMQSDKYLIELYYKLEMVLHVFMV